MAKKTNVEWRTDIYGDNVLTVSCNRGKLNIRDVYEALEQKYPGQLFVHLVDIKEDVPFGYYDEGDTWELYEPYEIANSLVQYGYTDCWPSEYNSELSEDEIKLCPFCGGSAVLDECVGCGYVHVRCTECGAMGMTVTPTEDTLKECRQKVIRAWNRRSR